MQPLLFPAFDPARIQTHDAVVIGFRTIGDKLHGTVKVSDTVFLIEYGYTVFPADYKLFTGYAYCILLPRADGGLLYRRQRRLLSVGRQGKLF